MQTHGATEAQSESWPAASKEGFAAAAAWIAADRDGEALIYRKFNELGARSLLYMQAEIFVLKKQLEAKDKEVARYDAHMDVKDAARTWEVLVFQCEGNNAEAQEQMKLIQTLRTKIKDYQEALVLQSQVASLEPPNARALSAFKFWFDGGTDAKNSNLKPFPALGGAAKGWLDDENDLAALRSHRGRDFLSTFLRDHWPVDEVSVDGRPTVGHFNEKSVSLAVNIIANIAAAVLLVGSITGLYFVSNPLARLLMLFAFTAVFALSVSVMTNAKRVEIFAATAAYAAVLVVFVGNGDLSGTNCCQS